MKSLYGQYIEEREGFDIIEIKGAFASYQIQGEACYIRDIYVVKSARGTAIATTLADTIAQNAKDAGCKFLLGSVAPEANGATEALKVLLAYGFKVLRISNDLIVFKKELSTWGV